MLLPTKQDLIFKLKTKPNYCITAVVVRCGSLKTNVIMNTQEVNLFLKEYGLLLENLFGLLFFGGIFIFVIFQNIKNKNWIKVICKTVLVFLLIIISIVLQIEKWYLIVFILGCLLYCTFIKMFMPKDSSDYY